MHLSWWQTIKDAIIPMTQIMQQYYFSVTVIAIHAFLIPGLFKFSVRKCAPQLVVNNEDCLAPLVDVVYHWEKWWNHSHDSKHGTILSQWNIGSKLTHPKTMHIISHSGSHQASIFQKLWVKVIYRKNKVNHSKLKLYFPEGRREGYPKHFF